MKTRSVLFFVLILLLLLFAAMPAFAGGWATVQLNELPDEIKAGEPFLVEFTVWQHGDKPVHQLVFDNQEPLKIEPIVSLTHPETGETIIFRAEPMRQTGRFVTELTLPVAGDWQWQIAPEPLAGGMELAPLSVFPAEQVVALQSSGKNLMIPARSYYALVVLAVVAILAVAGFLALRNQDAVTTVEH